MCVDGVACECGVVYECDWTSIRAVPRSSPPWGWNCVWGWDWDWDWDDWDDWDDWGWG